ncbi:MAG: putative acylase and diesterase, partial [Chlamydiia bacterium]|nr:putative acylase and diesterase [Chlamydiia bacterium]
LKAHRSDISVSNWLHTQTKYDAFWKQFNSLEVAENIQIPQIHVGGWYDIFLQGTIDAFQGVHATSHEQCRGQHKLVIGPWGHRWKRATSLGDFAPLAKGMEPQQSISWKSWLDYHMKGVDNGLKSTPTVQYYVMGPFDGTPSSGNEWRSAHKWPPDATYTQMYVSKEKLLQPQDPSKTLDLEEITYDIAFDATNPVPTIGGRNLFIADGPKDIQSIETRPDVVTFTTETLKKDTEITGKLAACLYVSNVFQERDICCRLCDVYPDGKSILIAEGLAHVSPQADKAASGPQSVIVDLWSTSIVFAAGHKIRLTVSGSNFPSFEASLLPNPDTKSNICFSLHGGGKHASYLALPVISAQAS